MIRFDAEVCNRPIAGRFWHVCHALIILVSLTCQNADSNNATLPTYLLTFKYGAHIPFYICKWYSINDVNECYTFVYFLSVWLILIPFRQNHSLIFFIILILCINILVVQFLPGKYLNFPAKEIQRKGCFLWVITLNPGIFFGVSLYSDIVKKRGYIFVFW